MNKMGGKWHVTDGKPTGGIVGSVITGIIIVVFSNIALVGDTEPTSFRVLFTILSIVGIPIAIFCQKTVQVVYDLIHGSDSYSVYVTKGLFDLITHKFLGAFIGSFIYCLLIWFILRNIFGL